MTTRFLLGARRPARRWAMVVFITSIVSGLCVAPDGWHRLTSMRSVARAEDTVGEDEKIRNPGPPLDDQGATTEGAASPEGAALTLAFVSGRDVSELIQPDETHFAHLWQMTNGGVNHLVRWSPDGRQLVLQAIPRGEDCDRIYTLPATGGLLKRISPEQGGSASPSFLPAGDKILFSSTHLAMAECGAESGPKNRTAWLLPRTSDLFEADLNGRNLRRISETIGFEGQAAVGPDGGIYFTSDRDGDLELYRMSTDGAEPQRLTSAPGYDGQVSCSRDGSRICWCASRPATAEERDHEQQILQTQRDLPANLEVFTANADGSDVRQVTRNGAANVSPVFTPDGRGIVYSSDVDDPQGPTFDLYKVDLASGQTERLTFGRTSDGAPAFSPEGHLLAFTSTRGADLPDDRNVYVAEWKD